jgi:small subunit ribosomal protein S2
LGQVGIAELLEAGVHFGHQTRRWNPKMRRFIYGERGGVYIIDLLKTAALLEQAQRFAGDLAHRGGTVLFVGTKKQARDTIRDVAEASGMPYVNHRWLGGLLTNFQTISLRIRRLHDLERYEGEGQLELLPTRERMAAQADLLKLRANLGGVKDMQRVPDAMFVIDLKTELIAVREAQRLRIPIIGLVDTNCDPDGIDYVVPGNDDAIRSCALITQAIGQVVAEGNAVFRAEEQRAREEAQERARIEAEARARREAEEQAQREAEERAAAEAAAAAQQAAAPASPAAGQAQPEAAPAGEARPAAPAPPPPAAEAPTPPPAPEAPAPAAEAAAPTPEAPAPAAAAAAPPAAEPPAPAPPVAAESEAGERPAPAEAAPAPSQPEQPADAQPEQPADAQPEQPADAQPEPPPAAEATAGAASGEPQAETPEDAQAGKRRARKPRSRKAPAKKEADKKAPGKAKAAAASNGEAPGAGQPERSGKEPQQAEPQESEVGGEAPAEAGTT